MTMPSMSLDNVYKDNHILLQKYVGDKLIYQTYKWKNADNTEAVVSAQAKLSSIVHSVAVDSQFNVYTGDNNYVTKFNADGTQIWQKSLSNVVYSVAVDSHFNVYTGDTNNYVTKFNADGTQIWQKSLSNVVYSVAVDSQFNVYTGAANYVSKFNAWQKSLSNIVNSVAVDSQFNVYTGDYANYVTKFQQKVSKT